jgi:hypothetical protein
MEVAANGMTARVVARGSERSWPSTRHRIVVSRVEPGSEQIDVTSGVVSAIAHALWLARGGDATANWVDAEHAVDALCLSVAGAAPDTGAGARLPVREVAKAGPARADSPAVEGGPSGRKRSGNTTKSATR